MPGEPRGAAISPTSSADQTWAILMAMVLVQNLVLTGSWSASDAPVDQQRRDVRAFPSWRGSDTTNANETLSITVAGSSLVAFFCQLLVVLPPADSPTTAATLRRRTRRRALVLTSSYRLKYQCVSVSVN